MIGNLSANRLVQLSSALDEWVQEFGEQNHLDLVLDKTTKEKPGKLVTAEKPRWQREYELWAKKNPKHRKPHSRHEWEKLKSAQLASTATHASPASEGHHEIVQDTSTTQQMADESL